MRILHVSTDYKPAGDGIGHGGVERLVAWLARFQRESGHSAAIGTLGGSEEPDTIVLYEETVSPLKLTDLDAYEASLAPRFDAILAGSLGIWDVIHDHMGVFAHYAMRFPDRLSCPVVLSTYAQRSHFAYRNLFERIAADRWRLPSLLVSAGSQSHREDLAPVLKADVVVHAALPSMPFHDGVLGFAFLTMAAVQPAKQQAEMAATCAHPFIFAGPLVDFDDASRAYASRFRAAIGAEVSLRGVVANDALPMLREAVDRHGTVYVGEVAQPEFRELLFKCALKLVLLNSTPEVFSLVVQEALARGIPVVTGPFASAVESLQGFGTIVTDLSAAAIDSGLRAPSMTRDAIQRYCRARFSPMAWTGLWDAVYCAAIARHGSNA